MFQQFRKDDPFTETLGEGVLDFIKIYEEA